MDHKEVTARSPTLELEVFSISDDTYVAAANQGRGKDIDSTIFKWAGDTLIPYQNLTTDNAQDWKFFTMDEEVILKIDIFLK